MKNENQAHALRLEGSSLFLMQNLVRGEKRVPRTGLGLFQFDQLLKSIPVRNSHLGFFVQSSKELLMSAKFNLLHGTGYETEPCPTLARSKRCQWVSEEFQNHHAHRGRREPIGVELNKTDIYHWVTAVADVAAAGHSFPLYIHTDIHTHCKNTALVL